ncbi:hypothetical protein E2C01_091647 [Portunus trituberculatus]|uniref:Uncharacterized protein n=1 Tax=Portunus trituberculatus TaxID=210409 RepID=A0A5B7JNH7_PORTR|nr:hypothetical protein [Portunus trituberculatus]
MIWPRFLAHPFLPSLQHTPKSSHIVITSTITTPSSTKTEHLVGCVCAKYGLRLGGPISPPKLILSVSTQSLGIMVICR